MSSDPPQPRTDKQVIDDAIADNRFGEYLLYGFAVAAALTGLSAVIVGLVQASGVVSLAGAAVSYLFIPAVRLLMKTRDQNMAIRLMEIPLNRSGSSKEAALLLIDFLRKSYAKDPTAADGRPVEPEGK